MRYGALLGTALLVASTARAATFTVNNLNDSGPESLRARIAEANASPGPDTINFSVTGTITLTSGQLQITDALTIVGPGAANLTVDGNANNRIFLIDVASPAACPAPTTPTNYAVTISGLTLQNARRNSDNSGGAIWSAHDLTVDSVVVQNNQAKSGAGISFLTQYANQKLMIKNSLFQNNIAKPLSSPVTGSQHGGAFRVVENCRDPINLNTAIPAIVDVSNSEFKANRAQPVLASAFGAAIFADAYADITISDSRIVGNQIDVPDPPVANQVYQGAGIRAQARSLTIVRSEIANNVVLDATGSDATRAGGIDVLLLDPLLQVSADAMTVAIVNSTVSDNSVSANAGGIRAL
ncbi:MAG TPA: hypothetical protein VFJ20_16125, partial [Gemmatimonadaceae bacterium]|nr:hypothetical protein [Gemmatimonadaceae bacterium]